MRFPLLNAYHGLYLFLGSLLLFGWLVALVVAGVDYLSDTRDIVTDITLAIWGGPAAVVGLLLLMVAEVISLVLNLESNTHNTSSALDDVIEELQQANANLRRTATAVEALASTIKRSS